MRCWWRQAAVCWALCKGLWQAERRPLEEGSRVGEYRIVRCLGSNGEGIFYLAQDCIVGDVVQLQEFFPAIDVKRNIRKLSKGMQKQVAFWLSLCCRPKLIVLDEPVDGLDPVMRRQNATCFCIPLDNLRMLQKMAQQLWFHHII